MGGFTGPRSRRRASILLVCWVVFAACGGEAESGAPWSGGPGADAGTETGADSRTDADTSTNTDTGTETDTDADTVADMDGGADTDTSLPMFVAQGHAGRTMISCDDGRTWVADQSLREWGYCNDHDCDHASDAGRGITWGDGWFFATFGWGSPGTVRRSRDGVSWETVLEGGTFGGVIYGNGRVVAASRNGRYSDDAGDSWREFDSVELSAWNVRDAAFVPYDGGRFIMAARDDNSDMVVSNDGASWSQPQSAPSDCGAGAYQGRIVFGKGTIVMTQESGVVCYSTDGGESWSSKAIADSLRSNGVWTGSEFMVWNYGTLYRSIDGQSWTSDDTVPSDIDLGAVAVSDRGTIVGVSNHWQQHYDAQTFYRSQDGVRWEILPSTAFTGGHPIKAIAFGYGEASEHCSP